MLVAFLDGNVGRYGPSKEHSSALPLPGIGSLTDEGSMSLRSLQGTKIQWKFSISWSRMQKSPLPSKCSFTTGKLCFFGHFYLIMNINRNYLPPPYTIFGKGEENSSRNEVKTFWLRLRKVEMAAWIRA